MSSLAKLNAATDGLTLCQLRALILIDHLGGRPAKDTARALGIFSRGGFARHLRHLTDMGLVSVRPSGVQKLLSITEAGKDRLARLTTVLSSPWSEARDTEEDTGIRSGESIRLSQSAA